MDCRNDKSIAFFFLMPFLTVYLLFTAYPLVQSVMLSMQQTYGPKTSEFVFLKNYQYLFYDPLFWKALKNTLIYTIGSLFIQLPLSLGLAMLLNQPWLRGRALFRLVFFSPSLVGIAFVAVLFTPIFAKNTGLLNITLASIFPAFDPEFAWLENYVMAALIIASLWMYVGFNMVYFLAALQNVEPSLIEAAMIDGAGPWKRFLHVTFPAIRPVASFVILLSVIGSFQLFELPYVMLNFAGGPDNRGLTVVMYLFQVGFESSGDLGYASAIGWYLALLLLLVTLIQRVAMRRHEN